MRVGASYLPTISQFRPGRGVDNPQPIKRAGAKTKGKTTRREFGGGDVSDRSRLDAAAATHATSHVKLSSKRMAVRAQKMTYT